jgi:hypothetical protein
MALHGDAHEKSRLLVEDITPLLGRVRPGRHDFQFLARQRLHAFIPSMPLFYTVR